MNDLPSTSASNHKQDASWSEYLTLDPKRTWSEFFGGKTLASVEALKEQSLFSRVAAWFSGKYPEVNNFTSTKAASSRNDLVEKGGSVGAIYHVTPGKTLERLVWIKDRNLLVLTVHLAPLLLIIPWRKRKKGMKWWMQQKYQKISNNAHSREANSTIISFYGVS